MYCLAGATLFWADAGTQLLSAYISLQFELCESQRHLRTDAPGSSIPTVAGYQDSPPLSRPVYMFGLLALTIVGARG